MGIKKITIVLSVFALLLVGCDSSSKKIGVIQMEELVYEFDGMKEATEEYTNLLNQWEQESDTLKSQLDQLLYTIKLDSINGDQEKIVADQQKFMLLRQKYIQLQQTIEGKAQQEDQKMTATVMGQLNEYVQKYGKENAFDIIITNTQMQNVGYVKASSDITKEVLEYVNKKYNGE